jgi:hypothetical protein
MHCLMLLSSRHWLCASLGSVRGRVSEFREAQKGIACLRYQPTEERQISTARPSLRKK